MGPPGDFDLAVLILRVLEAWELGNKGLYRNYRAHKKSETFRNFTLFPGIRKNDFYDFSRTFLSLVGRAGARPSDNRRRPADGRAPARVRIAAVERAGGRPPE